ncbi:MAG: hypothetical protein QM669_00870 [Siphonobacter sp.]
MKLLLFVIAISFFILSCQQGIAPEKVAPTETTTQLSLTSPNGSVIATSLSKLNEETSEMYKDFYSITKVCTVEKITYYSEIEKGFVALIEYTTTDGEKGKYLMGNTAVNYTAHLLVTKKSSSGGRTEDSGTTWKVTCSGSECCTPTFNLTTGNASCPCSSGASNSCVLDVQTIN